MTTITVYGASDFECVYCTRARDAVDVALLEGHDLKVDYKYVSVVTLHEQFGKDAKFPRILINDELIGGYDAFVKWLDDTLHVRI